MLRTVAEFFAAGVPVRLWCGQCGAAEANQLIVVRCVRCRRMVRYLASDLLALLKEPRRDAYAPPFPWSTCKTADHLKVTMHSPMPGDYGALVVRRPGLVRHTQTWRTVRLGD